MRRKEIIGRAMLVDLPKLKMKDIPAKIDTGAYYCSLHCEYVILQEVLGKMVLYIKPLDPAHEQFNNEEIVITDYTEKMIKSSTGEEEKRFVIQTPIIINKRKILTLISLTDRGSMKYPMLIGRRLLKNKFIVDASINHINK